MFEFNVAGRFLTEENEVKPNRYMARALWIGILCQTVCLVLNELDIFHTGKSAMRICYAVAFICMLIPQIIARSEVYSKNPKSKYFVLACVCVMTFTMTLALFIFSTPLCFLPMLLAVQYNSPKITRIAVIGSAICISVPPPLGCVLGWWDQDFLQYLISCAGRGMAEVTFTEPIGTWYILGSVIAYVSIPWLMTVVIFSHLIVSATKKGEDNVKNQVRIMEMSRIDALTGLYNQNVYQEFLESEFPQGSAGVMFFDVDGLKEINDTRGHEYGDLLLRRCVDSLRELFDEACHGFRIGGDEFLVYVDREDPKALDEKLRMWERSIERINRENQESYDGVFCHMSVGTAFGPKKEMSELITRADKSMYAQKQKYHETKHS